MDYAEIRGCYDVHDSDCVEHQIPEYFYHFLNSILTINLVSTIRVYSLITQFADSSVSSFCGFISVAQGNEAEPASNEEYKFFKQNVTRLVFLCHRAQTGKPVRNAQCRQRRVFSQNTK